jgi:hypothetical protein
MGKRKKQEMIVDFRDESKRKTVLEYDLPISADQLDGVMASDDAYTRARSFGMSRKHSGSNSVSSRVKRETVRPA